MKMMGDALFFVDPSIQNQDEEEWRRIFNYNNDLKNDVSLSELFSLTSIDYSDNSSDDCSLMEADNDPDNILDILINHDMLLPVKKEDQSDLKIFPAMEQTPSPQPHDEPTFGDYLQVRMPIPRMTKEPKKIASSNKKEKAPAKNKRQSTRSKVGIKRLAENAPRSTSSVKMSNRAANDKKVKVYLYNKTKEQCKDHAEWSKVKRALNTKRFHEGKKNELSACKKLLETLLTHSEGQVALLKSGRRSLEDLKQFCPQIYNDAFRFRPPPS